MLMALSMCVLSLLYTFMKKTITKGRLSLLAAPIGQRLSMILAIALLPALGYAEEPTAGELAAKCVQNYTETWHKHDAKAIAAMYTEDARYEDENGEVTQGRAAIEERATESQAAMKDANLTVDLESARLLGKDVLLIRGSTTLRQDGEESYSSFSATLTRSGENWLIADIEEKSLEATTVGEDELAKLSGLVGTWRPEGEDAKFESTVKMSLNGSFLTRKTKSLGEDEDGFTSVEIIGYDPVNDCLKSWFFDSEGGFGEGFWREDEDKWVVHRKVTMPDGGTFSSEYHVSWEDDDHLIVETVSKSLNGQVLPNTEPFKISRVGSEEDDLNLNEE